MGQSEEEGREEAGEMRTKLPAIVAALAIWATGAYPPWKQVVSARGEIISRSVGNDWLISDREGRGFSSVDYGRLAIEWAIIAALYGGAVVALRVPPPAKETK